MSININKASLTFGNMDWGNKPNKLVYHHLEATGWTIEDVHRCHREDKGWAGIGYHFYVRKDGSIWAGRDINAIGAHCPGANSTSIGICAEGRYQTETMPEVQKQALINLGIYLKELYPINAVYGHRDLYSTDCPGENYPLQVIKSGIMNGTETVEVHNTKTDNSILIQQIKSLQYWFNKERGTNLDIDGDVGTETLKAVNAYVVKIGCSGNIVRWIQQKLENWGYKITVDGSFGGQTAGIVKQLQATYGLQQDACIGPKTWQIFLTH